MTKRIVASSTFSSAVALIGVCLTCPGTTAAQDALQPIRSDRYGDPLEAGAIARLGSMRFRQHAGVSCAIVLPDNQTLLVVGEQLVYYQLPSGKLIKKLPIRIRDFNNKQTVVTPDHRLMAVAGFSFDQANARSLHHIRLIETETGNERFSLTTEDNLPDSGLAVSNDGSMIVQVGSSAGNVGVNLRLWDTRLREEKLRTSIEGIRNRAVAAFGPQGDVIAIGEQNQLFLWRWKEKQEPVSIRLAATNQRIDLQSLRFSPDGKFVAVGTAGKVGVLFVDSEHGKVISKLQLGTPHSYVTDLCFSPDQKYLTTVGDRNHNVAAIKWDLQNDRIVQRYAGGVEAMRQVSCSLDGKLVATSNHWSNLLEVYQVDSGDKLTGSFDNHQRPVNFLEFGTNPNELISAGDDGSLKVWDIEKSKLSLVIRHPTSDDGYAHWIRATAISPNGRFFATSSLDNTVRIWHATTGQELYQLAGHGRLGGQRCLQFSPDSSKLFSFGDDKRVYTWDTSTGKAIDEYRLELPEFKNNNDPFGGANDLVGLMMSSCHFSHDGSQLVLGIGALVSVDTTSGKESTRITARPSMGRINDAIMSPDQQYLLQSSLGPPTQTPLKDGRVRFSAGEHHLLKLFLAADGSLVEETQFENTSAGPMTFSGDGKYIAVASYVRRHNQATIRILDATNLSLVRSFDGLSSAPQKLAFSQHNQRLAAGLANTTILVWNTDLPQ